MGARGWIALALAAASLLVFSQVLGHDFIGFDDPIYIVQNARLRDGFSLAGLVGVLRPHGPNWIPLTALSFKLDYAAYGLDPAGFLATNAILHALSAILLFLALSRMSGAVWRSGFVAAVFAIHPLHVESVAWANERKDVLSGLFFMLTLLAYARYAERPRCLRRYLLTLLCLTLGLMAKPTLVTLPFVLLLVDYWPLGRMRNAQTGALRGARELRWLVVEKLPMFAVAAAASAVTFFMQRSIAMADPEVLPLGVRLANALRSYGIYARQTVWPSHLAMFYPYSPDVTSGAGLAVAAFFVVGTTAVVLRLARARPYAPVGWFWYLGTLVPMIGLVQVGMQSHADRYTCTCHWSGSRSSSRGVRRISWRAGTPSVGSSAQARLPSCWPWESRRGFRWDIGRIRRRCIGIPWPSPTETS
jgi:protein O-mannosyl-transferase